MQAEKEESQTRTDDNLLPPVEVVEPTRDLVLEVLLKAQSYALARG